MTPAPIALFVYNRLDHTKKTVEALSKNILAKESDLIIFSDGSKNIESEGSVLQVRDYIKSISGFKTVEIIERKENLGLSRSIISGVTEAIARYGRIIVMEDDLVTSPYFLQYMNDGLNMYENDARVASIHGYVYPVKKPLPETFFLRGADCWGWATWKRAWNSFEPDGTKLLTALEGQKLTKEFDLDGSYDFSQMLRRQIAGETDSWAIRWHASAFLAGMLTLYPGISLVDNIGQDKSGTHKGNALFRHESLESRRVRIGDIAVEENRTARKIIADHLLVLRPSIASRILRKLGL